MGHPSLTLPQRISTLVCRAGRHQRQPQMLRRSPGGDFQCRTGLVLARCLCPSASALTAAGVAPGVARMLAKPLPLNEGHVPRSRKQWIGDCVAGA